MTSLQFVVANRLFTCFEFCYGYTVPFLPMKWVWVVFVSPVWLVREMPGLCEQNATEEYFDTNHVITRQPWTEFPKAFSLKIPARHFIILSRGETKADWKKFLRLRESRRFCLLLVFVTHQDRFRRTSWRMLLNFCTFCFPIKVQKEL